MWWVSHGLPYLYRILICPCFAGIDVGGGHRSDFDEHSASYIPLRWMIKEAIEANTKLVWKEDQLLKIGIKLPRSSTAGRTHAQIAAEYYVTPNQKEPINPTLPKDMLNAELAKTRAGDVKETLSDSLLEFNPLWWILEFMPIVERKQAAKDAWKLKPS